MPRMCVVLPFNNVILLRSTNAICLMNDAKMFVKFSENEFIAIIRSDAFNVAIELGFDHCYR